MASISHGHTEWGDKERERESDREAERYKLRYILKSLYQASGEVVNDFSDAFVLDWIIYTQNERELYEMDFLTSLGEASSGAASLFGPAILIEFRPRRIKMISCNFVWNG